MTWPNPRKSSVYTLLVAFLVLGGLALYYYNRDTSTQATPTNIQATGTNNTYNQNSPANLSVALDSSIQPTSDKASSNPTGTSLGQTTSRSAFFNTITAQTTLYLDPDASLKTAPASFSAVDKSKITAITNTPTSVWFGDWNSNIEQDVKERLNKIASNQIASVVIYNIPYRDCGGYSAGGAQDEANYNQWIAGLSKGLASTRAIVMLEPDAVANIDCLDSTQQQSRYNMIRQAVLTLKQNPNTAVYIDAGHSKWLSPQEAAGRLIKAGVDKADGFSLNISNFNTTANEISYGSQISSGIGNKHFVIDTSRNGLGPHPALEWCNPTGRAVGQKPSLTNTNPLVDALLWVKPPGESDGTCNGGPVAGNWWPEYALQLAKNAGW